MSLGGGCADASLVFSLCVDSYFGIHPTPVLPRPEVTLGGSQEVNNPVTK